MIPAVVGLFDLVVGSFLNVVIHRVPLGRSVAWPSSRCPFCGTLIRAFDNVPVLSYLVLRGRCRNCKARISPRYPVVEGLTGLLFGLAAYEFGLSLALVSAHVLISRSWRSRGSTSSTGCCRTRSWSRRGRRVRVVGGRRSC